MRERHDIVVVGGGQAGLAMSYCLRQHGREHIVLERQRIAERWHSERWDSLAFQFPNWTMRLPGWQYQGDDRDGFVQYRAIVRHIEDYALLIDAPVRCGAEVIALKQDTGSDRFLVETRDALLEARHVVIATGPFQRPSLPGWRHEISPRIFQVHASRYRNPEQLPRGAVLVVGSGGSGCQIAEELYQAGRTVYLSVSRHRRVPRRYRGRDLTWWALERGMMNTPVDSFPERKPPPSVVITGVNGGHDINVRQFAADGVVVLGRLLGMANGTFAFDEGAEAILAGADAAYQDWCTAADDYASAKALDLPEEPDSRPSFRPLPAIPSLDAAEVSSIVWATGYGFDFGWVKLPVLDERGAPVQRRGVTGVPNAYFLGLHWMHTFNSGLFSGVGEDAAYLADRIAKGP